MSLSRNEASLWGTMLVLVTCLSWLWRWHQFKDFKRSGLPGELLYADDLVSIVESLDEAKVKFKKWKKRLESNGLRVITEVKLLGYDQWCGWGTIVVIGKLPWTKRKNRAGSNQWWTNSLKSIQILNVDPHMFLGTKYITWNLNVIKIINTLKECIKYNVL